jgi:hypothetical protein
LDASERAAVESLLLADYPVVFPVWAGPKPHDIRDVLDGKGLVVQTQADGPEAADSLEVQGGVPRVLP